MGFFDHIFGSKSKHKSTFESLQEEFQKKEQKFQKGFKASNKGTEYENQGNIELAIKYYEQSIAAEFEGTHPYKRLCIIYRKQKRYNDEIRIIKTYMNMGIYSNTTNNKQGWFEERLSKAEKLKNKSS